MPKEKQGRDYKREYKVSQSSTKAKKDRAGRNKARAMAVKAGKAKKGDGKDVHHKDGNPRNNKSSNHAVKSKSSNRSFARTKTAGKKNKRS